MNDRDITSTLLSHLERKNCRGKIVSIEHIPELRENFKSSHNNGSIAEEFYERDLIHLDFDIAGIFPRTKSLIVAAVPQPHVRVTFHLDRKPFLCVIPSNYNHKTDDYAQNIIESHLNHEGYFVERAKLPLKSLAVQSGLAKYGRNNIAYVEGMGSFFRLVAFVSDLPCSDDEDDWGEFKIMEHCEECTICQKLCPTGAIPSDRFLLRAERCLTFFSEWPGEFPDWLDPYWHHCLVGCLMCQKTCPVNRTFKHYIVDGPTFSSAETEFILKSSPGSTLSDEILEKLNRLDITEYAGLLGRNLRALIDNRDQCKA